ncbi:RidA family protein [Brevibacillus daliensis]|uniref:RidA family protein n=1 Tax=Brevibacillus daliensis TaxID=2892995 RepID=UPI001E353C5C|nr:RidA family protein [Brevibacillus daliensis]
MQNSKQVKFINPETMPATFGYTNVVEVRNVRTIYVSGQVALNKDGQVVGTGDLASQTKQVFENIKCALEAAGVCFNDVVKLTFFLTDISKMQIVREIRDQYVNTLNPPASSAVEVRKLIRDELLIEIEAIAVGDL